jgi:hypothetical protein
VKEPSELAKAMEIFTYAEFKEMLKEWLKTGRMVWFAYGNLEKDTAV